MTGQSSVDRARRAVYGAFVIAGAMYAALLSRVPDIKEQLGLGTAQLGVALLAMSLGTVVGLPASGRIVTRFGAARTQVAAGFGIAAGMLIAGGAVTFVGSSSLLMAGLALIGVSTGIFDVTMNLQGAEVEQRLNRAIMPRFHAAFSAGTVASALTGAVAAYFRVPVFAHLTAVALVYVGMHHWFRVGFLPRSAVGERSAVTARSEWLRPRTLAIGVVVLAAAFTEGTANDWLAVALADGHALPHWVGTLGFAVFVSAMTVGRLAGTRLLDRCGRLRTLYAGFGAAAIGSVLVVFGGPVLAFAGAAVWGIGASLGFPVGMSAAADDPARAAVRVSVVSTIGYTAFVAGPPLLGFLGEHVGALHSLLVVGAMAVAALVAVPAVREPKAVVAADDARMLVS